MTQTGRYFRKIKDTSLNLRKCIVFHIVCNLFLHINYIISLNNLECIKTELSRVLKILTGIATLLNISETIGSNHYFNKLLFIYICI